MPRTFGLIGVPSSAGAHWPGQEQAPRWLRAAGLVEHLQAAGATVVDHGDLPRYRFRPDPVQRHQQNLAAVVAVARAVADGVEAALREGQTPLVLGGDCTILVGALAGAIRHDLDWALLYFDGHADLNTPATSPSGILDSMGAAHLVGEPGAAEELSRLGPRYPLLPAGQIVWFGYSPRELNPAEANALARHARRHYPLDAVQGRAATAAAEALADLEGRAARFWLHFDVDVVDFADLPLADVPQQNAGLPFREALDCLAVFAASPRFGGLTITEVNPDHADEEGVAAVTFLQGLADALMR